MPVVLVLVFVDVAVLLVVLVEGVAVETVGPMMGYWLWKPEKLIGWEVVVVVELTVVCGPLGTFTAGIVYVLVVGL